jgi:carboxyl-terminal processing protease
MSYSSDDNSRKSPNPFIPLYIGLALAVGVAIGYYLSRSPVLKYGRDKSINLTSGKKLGSVIDYIESQYVESVDKKELEDKALTALLHSLDPHSDYIPASEFQEVNEPIQGNFEGIGVEFNIFNDTITVVTPISGGPAQKAGVLPGDKIIFVEKKKIAGVKITNKEVFGLLRGKKGTTVQVSVLRRGDEALQQITIERDEIPLNSVEVSYMLNKEIGYVKISRFAMNTHEEFVAAYTQLLREGMKKMVLDLRGNPGGVLPAAVNICDEFLSKGYTIVYTEGKASSKRYHKSTAEGKFENNPVVILIDEGSASASEIVAGALQDNDRASIVGRRSFGKGLVQEQMDLDDGSAIRLTVARYYTPTGRCIQKPYGENNESYYEEEYNRLEKGELFSADSIKFPDSLKYRTPSGKVVYGGGGIMPDVFVPFDTSFSSSFLSKIIYGGWLNNFAFQYSDKNRDELRTYISGINFSEEFNVSAELMNEFLAYLEKNKVKKDEAGLRRSGNRIRLLLKAYIGRNIFNDTGYYAVINQEDKTLKKAMEVLVTQKK